MPPKTRATKLAKGLKENIIPGKNIKSSSKISKLPRKPLADKTNSASDDNASIEVKKSSPKKNPNKSKSEPQSGNHVRSRRERRVPSRFIENHVITNIPINNKQVNQNHNNSQKKKNVVVENSPFKSPQEIKDSSLVANRPKRIHRLPSRFEDHSISPNKFIPVQPCFASTPIAKQTTQVNKTTDSKQGTNEQNLEKNSTAKDTISKPKKVAKTTPVKKVATVKAAAVKNNVKTTPVKKLVRSPAIQKNQKKTSIKNIKTKNAQNNDTSTKVNEVPDNNNNPKHEMLLRRKQTENVATSPVKKVRPQPPISSKRLINNNFSYRVLDDRKESPKCDAEKLGVYEFTFDPSEEPPPQKKKRRRAIRKKVPTKPKVVIIKNNYAANISKTLENLKHAVNKTNNPHQIEPSTSTQMTEKPNNLAINTNPVSTVTNTSHTDEANADNEQNIVERSEPADAMDFNDHMNYSPLPSPSCSSKPQVKMSTVNETRDQLYIRARSTLRPENPQKDPLNLIGELSFFDEEPVASSSMNQSARHPLASPWRVDYTNLPIKWSVSAHVKPNMTPAVESSFINSHETKKHVYTDIIPQSNDSLPEIVTNDTNTTNMKQTSIIDFIREAAMKSANKTKNKSSAKANQTGQNTPKKQPSQYKSNSDTSTSHSNSVPSPNVTPDAELLNTSRNSDQNKTPLKRKNDVSETEIPPPKSSCIKEPDVDNCFGFDDSENQENKSPNKKDCVRALRPRAVLKEINVIKGPLRANLPVAAKTKFAPTSEVVNNLFNELKAAEKAPVLAENDKDKETSTTSDPSCHNESLEANDEESVHLFEDIDVVHHLKPQRRSYGKAKKMTFCQKTTLKGDTQFADSDQDVDSSDSEDSNDVPFKNPTIKPKKVTKKTTKKRGPKFSKKEEEEVEAWAAAFNSMCEDVEDFPLVLE